MITIRLNKNLVNVESWDEILQRPGFTSNLDPALHEPDSIIGRYVFSDMLHCGLSNCRSMHAKGYIITTKDGLETNIGKDCGRSFFGVDFDTQSNKLNRDIAEADYRNTLWSTYFQIDEIEDRVAEIRNTERGADWVRRQCQILIDPGKGLSIDVVRRINRLVKARTKVVTEDREATKQEFEDMTVRAGRNLPWPQIIEEIIGEIDGIEALYPENDLRQLLAVNVSEKLKELRGLRIDDLVFADLQRWAKWSFTVEQNLSHAIKSVEYGHKLLTPNNLEILKRFTQNARDRELVTAFLMQLKA